MRDLISRGGTICRSSIETNKKKKNYLVQQTDVGNVADEADRGDDSLMRDWVSNALCPRSP